MPLLLRHLMPLIVIGAFLLFTVVCTLALLALFGRLFARPPEALPRGPVIEGRAAEVPAEEAPPPETPADR